MTEEAAMRVLTRGDVDGVMCATLLKAAGVADKMVQAHPKDMQDGVVEVTPEDVVCNLPYVPGCAMWFDHHASEKTEDRRPQEGFKGRFELAPSAARLVYEYFVEEHPQLKRFEPLLEVVDRFDSARLSAQEVIDPSPAMLLAFVVDPRTGLGYHHSYRISNKEMTQMMPDLLAQHAPEEVLAHPDVRQRVERYQTLNEEATRLYTERTRFDGNVLITDLRDLAEIPPANRFLVYTLAGADDTNISIRLSMAKGGEKVSIQVGHNIFNRSSKTDVGELMASYGGGGHPGAGTCQVPKDDADRVAAEIVSKVKE
jgi:hypothetical protein